jgi:hypothetical protein
VWRRFMEVSPYVLCASGKALSKQHVGGLEGRQQ